MKQVERDTQKSQRLHHGVVPALGLVADVQAIRLLPA